MAKRNVNEQLDEWGNPISENEPAGSSDSMNASKAFERGQFEDHWEEVGLSGTPGRPRSSRRRPLKAAVITACSVLICIGLGFLAAKTDFFHNILNHVSSETEEVLEGNATPGSEDLIPSPVPEPTTPIPEPETPTPEPETPTPDPETPTPEPKTPTPDPETPTPDPMSAAGEWYDESLRYYYQQLTNREKELFAVLYHGIMEFRSSVDIRSGNYTETEIDRVMYVLASDSPELFQLGNHWDYMTSGSRYISISPEYRMTGTEYASRCDRIRNLIASLRPETDCASDDFGKEYIVYKYIIQHCHYYIDETDESETAGADACLCNGKAQCAGYSRGLSLLLRSFGIPCLQVSSEAIDHEWNIVQIGGCWYICDITFDDSREDEYQRTFPDHENAYLTHLNLPDRLAPDHRGDHNDEFVFPSCTDLKDNYIYREGIYISADTPDKKGTLTRLLDQAYQEGKRQYAIMIDDWAAYQDRDHLLSDFNHSYTIWANDEDGNCSFFLEVQ